MPAAERLTPADLLAAIAAAPGDPRPVPRVLLIAAHPDDEVIGVGTRLPRLAPKLTIAHATDGSPQNDGDASANGFADRPAYAAARRSELSAALALCGEPAMVELGIQDQTAMHRMVELTGLVAGLLRAGGYEVVLTHPYEGGHPDHDATAFAVQAAVRVLARDGVTPPARVEMTSYHNGPTGLTSGVFLPDPAGPTRVVTLTPQEQAFKRRLFACFRTQAGVLQYFRTDVEAFRLAPTYDFTRPPHAETLLYETFGWDTTGHQFRSLAADALRTLGLADAS